MGADASFSSSSSPASSGSSSTFFPLLSLVTSPLSLLALLSFNFPSRRFMSFLSGIGLFRMPLEPRAVAPLLDFTPFSSTSSSSSSSSSSSRSGSHQKMTSHKVVSGWKGENKWSNWGSEVYIELLISKLLLTEEENINNKVICTSGGCPLCFIAPERLTLSPTSSSSSSAAPWPRSASDF